MDIVYFGSAKEWHEWLLQQDLIGPRIIEIDTIINRSSPYILYLNELSYQELLSFKSFIKKIDSIIILNYSIMSSPAKVNKKLICCEPGCNSQCMEIYICKSCNKHLCNRCYQHTVDRSTREKFYKKYVSYCDTCIWFDMG